MWGTSGKSRLGLYRVVRVEKVLGFRVHWALGDDDDGPYVEQAGRKLPIKMRRNTLVMAAAVSMISALDSGRPLPLEAENVIHQPGWSILPSGLPLLVVHRTTEVPRESSIWNADDCGAPLQSLSRRTPTKAHQSEEMSGCSWRP